MYHTKTRQFFVLSLLLLLILPWVLIMQQEGTVLFQRSVTRFSIFLGKSVGAAGFSLLVMALLLSNRWKFLEEVFGGLDKIYRWHHLWGLWGAGLILIHPFFFTLKWLPRQPLQVLLFFSPIHEKWSVTMGVLSFWLMISLILLTLFPVLKYDRWKITHQFMDLVFLFASAHILFFQGEHDVPFLRAYLYFFMALGAYALLWKHLINPLFGKTYRYKVSEIVRLSTSIAEIALESEGDPMPYQPGQFAFFSFRGEQITTESHPYTIVIPPRGKEIRIIMKVLGDFTQQAYLHLQEGDQAILTGPFGRFMLPKKAQQLWISGGVGVTPFLCWARSLGGQTQAYMIDLFYCIHQREDAVHLAELESIQQHHSSFRVHLVCRSERPRITVSEIVEQIGHLPAREICMCGPKQMTGQLFEDFTSRGISPDHIHFEDFEFFKRKNFVRTQKVMAKWQ